MRMDARFEAVNDDVVLPQWVPAAATGVIRRDG